MKIKPHEGPQEEALASGADIVITGGANGGGKTWAITYAPTYCFKDPHFQGVIFRRTMPQIKNPGGLLEETNDLYPLFGADLHRGDYVWRLPAGGQIKLSGMQHPGDEEAWDGAQLVYLGFDQLEQFEQRQFFYMLGRMRSAKGKFNPFCYASCNPAPLGHWLGEFLDWWIGDDGFPIPERSGKLRYFFGSDDGWEWADKDDEKVIEMDGKMVRVKPLSVTFVPSKVTDNPSIINNDPAYLQKLNSLNYVDRQRKLHGNWHVSAKDGLFSRHNIQIVDKSAVPENMPLVRAWDLADTEPTQKNPKPCYTAGAKCGMTQEEFLRCHDCQKLIHNPYLHACPECHSENLQHETKEILWILDMARFQLMGGEKKRRMKQIAQADGKRVKIWVEQEPGSSGKDVARQYIRETFSDFICEADRPTGNKEVRATAWVAAAEEGRIRVVDGEWTVAMLRELEAFPSANFKDQVDAISLAYVKLKQMLGAAWSVRWGSAGKVEKPVEYKQIG